VDLAANAARFAGYSELYDRVRPSPPAAIATMLCAYADRQIPDLVVDLGSGSGLSSRWCATWATRVIGVEPGDDMRNLAVSSTPDPNVSFVRGWAHETGLPDSCADVIVAVQALHWMEPTGTFKEVARLLRPGGVFGAVDCDWPPAVGSASAEAAWERCRVTIRAYEARLASGVTGPALLVPIAADDIFPSVHFGRDAHRDAELASGVRSWAKDEHLGRMHASGEFRWSREVTAHSIEDGDRTRFVDLLRSQGDFQTLVKHGLDEDTLGVTTLWSEVRDALAPESHPFLFSWRARIGVT